MKYQIVADLHTHTLASTHAYSTVTEMVSAAARKGLKAIAHSGDPEYAYDYDKVIPEFGANHKLVEINNHTFDVRRQNIENCRKIALACKKYGVPIVINSDAHFETQVGNFANALKMLEEIDFPEELIMNGSESRMWEYLISYTNILDNRHSIE